MSYENDRRLRRLASTMQKNTARMANGEPWLGGQDYVDAHSELAAKANAAGVELIVETWHKVGTTRVEGQPQVDETTLEPRPESDEVDDRILATIGVEPRPAAALANALGMTDGAVRARLQALRDAGLVETAGNRGWRLA